MHDTPSFPISSSPSLFPHTAAEGKSVPWWFSLSFEEFIKEGEGSLFSPRSNSLLTYPLSIIHWTNTSEQCQRDRQTDTQSHLWSLDGLDASLSLSKKHRYFLFQGQIVYIVDQSTHKGVSYNTSSTHTAQPVNLDTIASWQKRKECWVMWIGVGENRSATGS